MLPNLEDFAPKMLPWQHPLTDPETNTRLNIYPNMSTIPENLVKIGLVVSEILCSKQSLKKERIGKKVTAA